MHLKEMPDPHLSTPEFRREMKEDVSGESEEPEAQAPDFNGSEIRPGAI